MGTEFIHINHGVYRHIWCFIGKTLIANIVLLSIGSFKKRFTKQHFRHFDYICWTENYGMIECNIQEYLIILLESGFHRLSNLLSQIAFFLE